MLLFPYPPFVIGVLALAIAPFYLNGQGVAVNRQLCPGCSIGALGVLIKSLIHLNGNACLCSCGAVHKIDNAIGGEGIPDPVYRLNGLAPGLAVCAYGEGS